MEKIDKAIAALFDYAHRVIEERRIRPPDDDFVSLLLQANEDKDSLSDQELYDMVVLAVFGGIDTTRKFGFDGGPHHCLSHFIARADMREGLKALARRIRNPSA